MATRQPWWQHAAVRFGELVLDATTLVSLRGGMTFGSCRSRRLSDNLTDTHKLTDYNFTINDGVDSPLRRDFTFRPRTFGITAISANSKRSLQNL